MKKNKYLNSLSLSLFLLGIFILSFLMIKTNKVKNVDTQVSNLSFPTSKKLSQTSPKFSVKDTVKNTGKILSIQHGGGYSFIEVELPSKKLLFLASANLPNKLFVGNDVHWEDPRLTKNYYSHALKQDFERLYMVTIKNDSIKSGVVLSIRTVDENTFLNIQQNNATQELIVKSERISGELRVGAKIEWRQEMILSDKIKQQEQASSLPKAPVTVEWIRNLKN